MGNDHLIKFHLTFSVDQNFLLIKAFDQKIFNFFFGQLIEFHLIFSVDRNFKITKNDIIKSFDQLPKFASYFWAVDQIFQSTEKRQKFWGTDYESFDQLKNDNFDQVNFGQTTPC